MAEFQDDQITEVLDRLANGESLRSISKQPGMPKPATFLLWVSKDPALAEQYTRAREAGQDAIGEEILEIADESTPATAVSDRLRFDARRWYLSKLAPKKYGDKLDVTSDNKPLPASTVAVFALPDNGRG